MNVKPNQIFDLLYAGSSFDFNTIYESFVPLYQYYAAIFLQKRRQKCIQKKDIAVKDGC